MRETTRVNDRREPSIRISFPSGFKDGRGTCEIVPNDGHAASELKRAVGLIADHYGCEASELTAESAEPFLRPFPGRAVWVWRGEFDADTACSLAVPIGHFRKWHVATNGAFLPPSLI